MALTVTVNVAGLTKLGELARLNLEEALELEAAAIVADAKERAPVLTGALRDSLTAEKMGDLEWEIHDGVSYGILQELGTSKLPAQPFLTPAMDMARERFGERVAKALAQAAKDEG